MAPHRSFQLIDGTAMETPNIEHLDPGKLQELSELFQALCKEVGRILGTPDAQISNATWEDFVLMMKIMRDRDRCSNPDIYTGDLSQYAALGAACVVRIDRYLRVEVQSISKRAYITPCWKFIIEVIVESEIGTALSSQAWPAQPVTITSGPAHTQLDDNIPVQRDVSRRVFIPDRRILGFERVLPTEIAMEASRAGLSVNPNYLGEITTFEIRNANTSEQENCAVFLTGIPAEATYRDVLRAVRTGKVLSSNINPAVMGRHPTAAAKIVFMTRDGATAFIQQSESGYGVNILGKRIRVRWNRDRVGPALYPDQSRVVRISVPEDAEGHSIQSLLEFFSSHFYFNLISTEEWTGPAGTKTIHFEFGSVRCQAEAAHMAYNREVAGPHYRIKYGPDPCDPFSSDIDRL